MIPAIDRLNLRECFIYYYCYFLKVNFKFKPKVCHGSHDITRKSYNI